MVSKVNLKARIERHSRVLKDNLGNIHPFRSMYHRFNYNIVLFFVVFLFPIYPLFASMFYDTSVYDFYRGDIDESSILESYTDTEDNNSYNISSKDYFLSVNGVLDEGRDISGYNEVIDYEVQPGESISTIAYKFNVSNNTIYWANNFDSKKVLHPGEKIKIPPVSGMVHKVVSGDTVANLAKKYKVSENKILEQNGLNKNDVLENDIVLIIPGAIKEIPKPKVEPKKVITKTNSKNTQTKKSGYSFTKGGKSQYVEDDSGYELTKRSPQHRFQWGNCTRFVAQYKDVDWGGNAKDWLYNASISGHATGKTPGVGAIIVFQGKGYNPRYGHVGIVVDVNIDEIIVKDMNYRAINEVTVRKVPKNDGSIKGYIYVD